MLERRSALAAAHAYASPTLKLEEAPGFTLTQVAGDASKIAAVTGALPAHVGKAGEHKGRTLFRIGPKQFWIVGPENDDAARLLQGSAAVTPLSSSRTRILLEGPPARAVLMKGIAIDFHPAVFTPGTFAMTGVHHMPLLVHCTGENSFHIYAMRSFAMSMWEWFSDAAAEFATGA